MTEVQTDPWLVHNFNLKENQKELESSFADSFIPTEETNSIQQVEDIPSIPSIINHGPVNLRSTFSSRDEYSKKLEDRLSRLQSCKDNKATAKAMLQNFKEERNLHMNQLLSTDRPPSQNLMTDFTSAEQNKKFLDKLYNTNSLYRHLNPQQGLELNEKQPLVKHDQLDIVSNEETPKTEVT